MQCELSDTDLGVLELGCDPYVVVSIQIGSPAVREVVRTRSLADGTLDDTRYVGARAITLDIRFNNMQPFCEPAGIDYSMQGLIDRLTPYMSPRRRPTLTWQLPRSTELRAAVVRGVNWGYTVAAPKAQAIAPQWVVPSGEILLGGPYAERCQLITPSTDVEDGRHYKNPEASGVEDAYGPYYTNTSGNVSRAYPFTLPVGGRIIDCYGTGPANWVLTFFGPVTNPSFTINDVKFSADRRGGVALLVGQTLVVNTRDRTVFLNGDPNSSRYQNVNFEDWGWDDLLIGPGENIVVFGGTGMTAQSAAQFCYTPTFL